MSEAQLCQTRLRMNGYFGNLLFCLKRIFCRISSFSRSHFLRPETILHIFRFETFWKCFRWFFVFVIHFFSPHSASYFCWICSGKIFTTGLKAISKILAALICYSKCRCLSFAVYLDITVTEHESSPGIWLLANPFPIVAFQNSENAKFEVRFLFIQKLLKSG